MDPMELALGFATFACIVDDIEEEQREQERVENLRDDLSSSGLDESELFFMDDTKRDEVLESAGLDPFDYEDFDW